MWIFLIFFLFAGSPTPDAGESHYLVKAKHYWNPAWCAGDLFLESADTHLAFYWVLGWLTRWFSLDATTWILRVVIWGLLAWSWRRLSWAVVPRPLWSLLSAGLMLFCAQNFHWAKEIVLRGGIEGKTVAYVGVFLALEAVARARWQLALVFAGAAAAFHVLVGGWMVIALGVAWCLAGPDRPALVRLLPGAAAGLLLALPGLVPALSLSAHVSGEELAEAYRIYAFERLAHHIVFHLFGVWNWVRHAALIAVFAVMAWQARDDLKLRRVSLVVVGAIAIAVVGIAIDQGTVLRANWLEQSADEYERFAARLLRFYWFRLGDALVPVGAALAAMVLLQRTMQARPALGQWLLGAAVLVATFNVADACYWRARLRVPGAVLQQQPTADTRVAWWWEDALAPDESDPGAANASKATPRRADFPGVSAREHYDQWQAACRWIADNTPATAKFLTPRRQQTFKWNAERAEVVTRKDLPQDPASILAWDAALRELYPRDLPHWRYDLAAFSDQELTRLARKYNCQYIVVERRMGGRQIRLPRVYPDRFHQNQLFEIFRVPQDARP